MSGFSVVVLCLASVTAYVGVTHLLNAIKTQKWKKNLPFALTCFAIALYDVLSARLYSSSSAQISVYWQRCQLITLCDVGIFILWFVSDLVDRKNRLLDYLFFFAWTSIAIVLWFDRTSLTWTTSVMDKNFKVFGATCSFYEMAPGVIPYIQDVVGALACVYIVASLVRDCKTHKQRGETVPVILGMCVFSLGVLNDIFVGSGFYQFIYLIEYAYMFLVFGMAYSLSHTYSYTQKKLKHQIEESHRLATAVEHAAESIIITDPQGIIVYVNPCFEKMTGFSKKEILGQTTSILKSGKQDNEFYADMWEKIAKNHSWQGRFTNRRKDGTFFEEQATISAVLNDRGRVVNYVAVKRDITQEVLLENELRHSQKMDVLGKMASKVAHDFTNILVVIFGHCQIMKNRIPESSDLHQHLDEVLKSSTRASNLTGELLAFAHKQNIVLKKTDLNKVITGMKRMLLTTIEKHCNPVINVSSDPLPTELDRGLVEQSVVHLAMNAAEAMPKGGLFTIETDSVYLTREESIQLVEVSQLNTDHHGGYAMIHISDTGVGLDKDTQEHIFEPFYTTKDDKNSTGLGLSTVYAIIKKHGGYITVYSKLNRGTCFTIYLPLIAEPDVAENADPVIAGNLEKTRILLLKKDSVTRHLLAGMLRQMDGVVLEAGNSQDALSIIDGENSPIDIIMMDLLAVKDSEPEFMQRINQLYPHAKIIYLSNFPALHLKRMGLLEENSVLVSAPFTRNALRQALFIT